MSNKKTILKNISALFGAQIITSLLTPVLFVFISRNLGNEVFGKYSFNLALCGVFLLVAEFGMKSVAIRDVARDLPSLYRYFQNVAFLKLIFSILSILVFILVINMLGMPQDTTHAAYIFAGGLFFQSMSNTFRWVFHAVQVMEKEAFQRVSERVLILLLSLLALWRGFGLIALASAFLVSQIVVFFLSLFFARKLININRFEVDLTFCKSILQTSVFFALCDAAYIFFFRIDVIMLGKFTGESAAGWYNAAFVILSFISIISMLLVQVMFPILSNLYENNKNELKEMTERMFRYLLIIGMPIIPVIFVFSERVINLLYGEEFSHSAMALKVLICSLIFLLSAGLFTGILTASNRHKMVAVVNLSAMIVNVILNFILIPQYGYWGAGISATITQLLLCSMLYLGVLTVIDIKILKVVLNALPGFVAMVAVIYIPVNLPLVILSLIAIFVYLFLSYITGSIKNEDITFLSGLFIAKGRSIY